MTCPPARTGSVRPPVIRAVVPVPTISWPAGLALTLVLVLLVPSPIRSESRRHGEPGMLEPSHDPLLVSYYEFFLRDQDANAYCSRVLARYTEGTLGRLVYAGETQARRAAVLALGLIGSFEANPTVAHALKDDDAVVRDLANSALWVIWFRADTPENNALLEQVAALIKRQRLEEAEALATALIARAPRFAEAYNQRAIAAFLQGRLADSAADCRRVLERNPYHIGALAGLGRCYLQLDRRAEALQTFRRALKLQPHNADLRQTITALEAGAE